MTKHRPNQPRQNDSSKTIEDIAKKYSKKIDLQKKIIELMEMTEAQNKVIDDLTAELTRLKVDGIKSSDIKVYENMPEDEKLIAEMQLTRLKASALGRDLTLEETRKFEIFSKIKNMDSNTKKPEKDLLPKDVTPKKLMAIASGSKKKTDEQ